MSIARSNAGCARFLTLIDTAPSDSGYRVAWRRSLKPHDTCLPEYDRAVRILDMFRQAPNSSPACSCVRFSEVSRLQ